MANTLTWGDGNIDDSPLFVTGPQGDFYLSQINSGQVEDSPCVDAGSDLASVLGMFQNTTRTDELNDIGIVDMGFHFILPEPPSHDDCENAISVEEGVPFQGATNNATGSSNTTCGFSDTNDAWHSFTPALSRFYTISLCGSSFDTTLAIFDACEGTEIACNDNACGSQSEVIVNLTANQSYLIRVAGSNGETGDYGLLILPPICTEDIVSDLSGDCRVNIEDYAMFVSDWLHCNLEPQVACWE